MDGLNMEIIKALPIELPSIDVQREFVHRARHLRALVQRLHATSTDISNLNVVLQNGLFGGGINHGH